MTKPPRTPPNSDIDGIHEDERPNVETAARLGQDSGDVARAKEQSIARPQQSDQRPAGREEKR